MARLAYRCSIALILLAVLTLPVAPYWGPAGPIAASFTCCALGLLVLGLVCTRAHDQHPAEERREACASETLMNPQREIRFLLPCSIMVFLIAALALAFESYLPVPGHTLPLVLGGMGAVLLFAGFRIGSR